MEKKLCVALWLRVVVVLCLLWSLSTVGVTNSDESEKSFADARRRPCRPAPTVPPRPVPWLPMAMADLTRAVGIASRRARAQGSPPPSPVGDVGKRKQLRLLFARPQLFLAMPTLLRGNGRTLPCVGRAAITSAAQGHAQDELWTCKKNQRLAPRKGANRRWRCSGHVYDGGRASMRRLCVRALCM